MLKRSSKVGAFRRKILQYYKKNGRDLPWRKTTDPYAIWISEVMLQQTQVDRVKGYYERWLSKFPTVKALARARRESVLRLWMGLGYNSRAINLHKAAKVIVQEYQGDVLAAIKDFKNLPGVGPYTCAAVQIFATNAPLVTVDTNIRRILIQEFGLSQEVSDRQLWQIAQECLPRGRSRDWHNALMDYGATLMTARNTGIRPKTRQSKFEGSDRQIRARVLRAILNERGLSMQAAKQAARCEDDVRFKRIVHKMIDEGVIRKLKGGLVLMD